MEHYPANFPITYITSKNANELWIGTINGLYKFDKREKKLQQVNYHLNFVWNRKQETSLNSVDSLRVCATPSKVQKYLIN